MKNRNERGYALILVIMIVAVLSILITSLLSVALADKKHAVRFDRNAQAHLIGRSGIAVGLKALDDRVAEKINEVKADPDKTVTVEGLVTAANTYAITNLKDKIFTDQSAKTIGKYTITYEKFSTTEIKVISDSVANGIPDSTDRVTLIVKVKTGSSFTTNPDEWINGGSQTLKKNVNTPNYLKHAVKLTGKGNPIKIPSNSGHGTDASFYKAQLIYFTDEKGVSFKQESNVIDVTFDAEIIFFETVVELRDDTDPVYLKLSDEVIDKREDPLLPEGIIPKCGEHAGFESYNRYKAFIGTQTLDLWDQYDGSSNDADNYSYWFDSDPPTDHYGVVKFGGGIKDKSGNTVNNSDGTPLNGYYFFKSGANLHAIASGDFIKINENDAIIKVIEGMVYPSIIRDGRIWNER